MKNLSGIFGHLSRNVFQNAFIIVFISFALNTWIGSLSAVELDVSVSSEFSNAYVWRGITFNDEGVIQPSIDISHENGLALNIWGNFDLGNRDGAVEIADFSEVDFTLSYPLPLKFVDASVGIIEYLFPQGGKTTREVYLDMGVGICDGLSLGLTGYYDYDQVHGFYGTVGLGYSVETAGDMTVGLSGGVGIAEDDFSKVNGGRGKLADSGLFDWNVRFDVTHKHSDNTDIGFFVAYTDNFDGDILIDQITDIYGGINISRSF